MLKFFDSLGHLFHGESQFTPDLLDAAQVPTDALQHDELALVARRMLETLQHTWASDAPACPRGLVGITVAPTGIVQLMNFIPGLRTLDPSQMNASDVSRLLAYLSANEPAVYERAAAMLSWHKPSLRPVLAQTAPIDFASN